MPPRFAPPLKLKNRTRPACTPFASVACIRLPTRKSTVASSPQPRRQHATEAKQCGQVRYKSCFSGYFFVPPLAELAPRLLGSWAKQCRGWAQRESNRLRPLTENQPLSPYATTSFIFGDEWGLCLEQKEMRLNWSHAIVLQIDWS
ncbi:hypothetical protein OOU_Y34scaffold00753g5 [Pyricularia oryzae Y34]|uniref:Uncharacterized protein n=2 Tax=Pyricularia oryzae TaxID=318829 RepID=A0AA97PHE8_PYRO3|nr:hypothetical protein OOU_Y34scaffold00753g5 [Pyricularia oryzae Y34]